MNKKLGHKMKICQNSIDDPSCVPMCRSQTFRAILMNTHIFCLNLKLPEHEPLTELHWPVVEFNGWQVKVTLPVYPVSHV